MPDPRQDAIDAARRNDIGLPVEVEAAAIESAAHDMRRDIVSQLGAAGLVLISPDTEDRVANPNDPQQRLEAKRRWAETGVEAILAEHGFNTPTFSYQGREYNLEDVVDTLTRQGERIAGDRAAERR